MKNLIQKHKKDLKKCFNMIFLVLFSKNKNKNNLAALCTFGHKGKSCSKGVWIE
jgi:hypothetical protein